MKRLQKGVLITLKSKPTICIRVMLEMNSKYSIITGIAFVDILSLRHCYHLAVTPLLLQSSGRRVCSISTMALSIVAWELTF